MEKVIILSCSTGQGHNSCALALKEYVELQQVHCEIQDSLEFVSRNFAQFMSWGLSFMYRYIPSLFRWGYRFGETHPGVFGERSAVCQILNIGAKRMHAYLLAGGFDTVICTHVLSAIMLTQMLKQYPLPVKTAFVATDYTCYPGMSACDLQQYFIACSCMQEYYQACGIPAERIAVTGIPVRRSFFASGDQAEAKRRLDIREQHKHLLVMCGSMGCGPIAKIVKLLSNELPDDVDVTVICGTNQRLYRKLSRRYGDSPRIHPVGYTRQMPLYMDSADLYLTKPGGISVTEAAAKGLPMAFVNAVAGCEQYNMDFFMDMGAAITADSPAALTEECIGILCSASKAQQIKRALHEYHQMNGAENIFCALNGGHYICSNQPS